MPQCPIAGDANVSVQTTESLSQLDVDHLLAVCKQTVYFNSAAPGEPDQ